MTATTDPVRIRALFERWIYEVHEQVRIDLVPECVGPVYIRHENGETRHVPVESYAAEVRAQHLRLLDWKVQVHDVVIDRDRCWWRGTWSFTDADTGERLLMADLGIYRVEDGKLAELWGFSTAGFGRGWPEQTPIPVS